MGMVLGDGGRLLVLGLCLGLLGSALLARAIRGMLFGVPPEDPVGGGGPALRGGRVDPLVAMRAE
jgi:hypothetical protein